jgi:hypothetical protein
VSGGTETYNRYQRELANFAARRRNQSKAITFAAEWARVLEARSWKEDIQYNEWLTAGWEPDYVGFGLAPLKMELGVIAWDRS